MLTFLQEHRYRVVGTGLAMLTLFWISSAYYGEFRPNTWAWTWGSCGGLVIGPLILFRRWQAWVSVERFSGHTSLGLIAKCRLWLLFALGMGISLTAFLVPYAVYACVGRQEAQAFVVVSKESGTLSLRAGNCRSHQWLRVQVNASGDERRIARQRPSGWQQGLVARSR